MSQPAKNTRQHDRDGLDMEAERDGNKFGIGMMAGRRLWMASAAVVAFVAVVVAAVVLTRDGGASDVPRLAGAFELASGGDQSLDDIGYGQLSGAATLDDISIRSAWAIEGVGADPFLLVFADDSVDPRVVRAYRSGAISMAGPFVYGRDATAAAVGTNGEMGVAYGTNLSLRSFGDGSDMQVQFAFSVGAVDFSDTIMAVGGSDSATVGVVVPWSLAAGEDVGPATAGYRETHVGGSVSRVAGVGVLTDDRVAILAETDAGGQLFVWSADSDTVQPVELGADVAIGVADAEPTGVAEGRRSSITTPLAAAPGGRVLVTGLAEDGHPVISWIDVDSGEVEVLADLEGVEPTIEQPVSAAFVGDDLIFLAEDRLWMKENIY